MLLKCFAKKQREITNSTPIQLYFPTGQANNTNDLKINHKARNDNFIAKKRHYEFGTLSDRREVIPTPKSKTLNSPQRRKVRRDKIVAYNQAPLRGTTRLHPERSFLPTGQADCHKIFNLVF